MKFKWKWLENTPLHYKMNVIIALFFLFPTLGFLYFGFKYEILTDKYIPLFFLGFLFFSFLGMLMLRKMFDEISAISKEVSQRIGDRLPAGADELQGLIRSFSALESRFSGIFRELEKKKSDIAILKELSDLCYVTFDPEEIMYVTLERALALTRSEIGSVLIIDRHERKSFVVKACIGLGDHIRIGSRVPFDTSIAKYAVINKSPLVVRDIEKDSRFGRANRAHYGTKSFVCMPIKTSKEIIGVLTISRRDEGRAYENEDVEVLIPLLSNAAFTYENLRLLRENDQGRMHLRAVEKIFTVINSSFRGSELIHAILNEIQALAPFEFALVLIRDRKRVEDGIVIAELLGNAPATIAKGGMYKYEGSVIDKVLKQRTALIIDNTDTLTAEVDKAFFVHPGNQSCLLAPLKIDGGVSGVLALSAEKSDMFHHIQNLIEWIASGISLAMERNMLSDAVIQRDQELDSIKQIGRALASSTFDISKVLNYTMDMIRIIINTEAGTLFLIDDTDELESAVSFNMDLGTMESFRLKLGQGVAGYVAARGESIIVNDAARSPHFYPEIDRLTGFRTRSILCIPMISQGRVIGVIEVLNKIGGNFSPNDEDLLQSIASSVSIAIENARLYKETVAMAEHERGIRGVFQKFVPKQILDKIIHGTEDGKAVVDELKTLTLLNIDIRSSSEFVKKIGPQKTVSLLNNFFSVMGGIVFKHHGIVDKYLGDGFLALFGAPVSSTVDAENAVNAALEMKASVGEINDFCRKTFDETVVMGISIHTGEVVVGNIGFDMKMDYTVIGDPVNTVFRLQEYTKPYPNGIIISENVCRAALCRLDIREISEKFGRLKMFELLGRKED
ncbi:hypothetical protein DENIS_0537 [Desulfonema ishimotonii]|uniref:Guanylate cyclase domain-containing protein n=1 Tax=Desulfonema ishimotonii TaxID=45657 RepID=A0A401FRL1_9BACT|nr:GAF domain-containing protein [Desulfonema ishimotonii]GBC59598.1 hypothetical protein DENIS_0537 [Desulfonema ishimotonii]